MPASIVESASPGLLNFTYDGDQSPSGVLDARTPLAIRRVILAIAPRVRESFVSSGQKTDCRYACATWMRVLEEQGIEAYQEGGVGIDEEQSTSDWQRVPAEARSGYRESDGQIHRHFWLLIGRHRLLFDPTAHQFDTKGGVSLDRYIIDGRPVKTRQRKKASRDCPSWIAWPRAYAGSSRSCGKWRDVPARLTSWPRSEAGR